MPAKVMILGVAHLKARRDVHNAVFADSPLSPERQAQIADVVAHLARFKPTKVLVEVPFGNPVYAQRYARYVAGKYQLPADEVYQFGFRLAAREKNGTIYPIDTFGPSLIDENSASGKRIIAFLMKNFKAIKDPVFDAFVARSDELERTGTYLDLLRYMNTDAAIRANASSYSVLTGMGREADNAGSTYVSQWYARNEYLLREFVRLNPNLTYVDPLTYLK